MHTAGFSHSVCLSGISSIQMQHFVLALVEAHLVHISPFLILVQIPLDGIFCCINCLIQLDIKLAQSLCVTDKDMEHCSQAEPLVYTTCDQPAVAHKADSNSLIVTIQLILYPLNSPYFSNSETKL